MCYILDYNRHGNVCYCYLVSLDAYDTIECKLTKK